MRESQGGREVTDGPSNLMKLIYVGVFFRKKLKGVFPVNLRQNFRVAFFFQINERGFPL